MEVVINGNGGNYTFVEYNSKSEVDTALELALEFEAENEKLKSKVAELEKQLKIAQRDKRNAVDSERCTDRLYKETSRNIRVLFKILTEEQKKEANLNGFDFQVG